MVHSSCGLYCGVVITRRGGDIVRSPLVPNFMYETPFHFYSQKDLSVLVEVVVSLRLSGEAQGVWCCEGNEQSGLNFIKVISEEKKAIIGPLLYVDVGPEVNAQWRVENGNEKV